jgi:hypothetical protein
LKPSPAFGSNQSADLLDHALVYQNCTVVNPLYASWAK